MKDKGNPIIIDVTKAVNFLSEVQSSNSPGYLDGKGRRTSRSGASRCRVPSLVSDLHPNYYQSQISANIT